MSDGIYLRDLIRVSEEDINRAAAAQHAEGDRDTDASLAENLKGFGSSVAAEKLNDVLDKDVTETLAEGWSKLKDVRGAAARTSKPPGTTEVLTLGKHEQRLTYHPVLTVSIGSLPAKDFPFTLELVAQFKSVKLEIGGGRIRSVAPGDAAAIARLKYKSALLKEKPTPAWKLPGRVRLPGQGVPVAE